MTLRRFIAIALVSLVLVGAASSAGCSKGAAGTGAKQTTTKMRLLVVAHEVDEEGAHLFAAGQPVRIRDTKTLLGTIESVEVTASMDRADTADGRALAVAEPGLRDVRLTVVGDAVPSAAGNKFGSEFVYMNDEYKMVTPLAAFKARIFSIEPVE